MMDKQTINIYFSLVKSIAHPSFVIQQSPKDVNLNGVVYLQEISCLSHSLNTLVQGIKALLFTRNSSWLV